MTSSTGEIKAARRQIVYHQIGYVRALRNQLRGLDPLECLHDLRLDAADQLAGENNVALALGRRIGGILATLSEKGWINPWQWQAANSTLRDLIAAQGGTERIKNTPLPKQYDLFLTFVVVMYCMLLPVGMVEGLGWLTPLGSTAVVFIFLALDRIGRNLEAPFDNRVYDGPLTAITNNVDINLRQVLGDKDLPVIEQPIRGVPW